MTASSFLTPQVIAQEALFQLENNLVAGTLVFRDHETEFGPGRKIGDTVTIRRPPEFQVSNFGSPARSASGLSSPYGGSPLDRTAADGTQTTAEDGSTAGDPAGNPYTPEIYIQDIHEGGVPMVLSDHLDVSVKVGSKEMSLEFDRFSENVITPAMIALADKIDRMVYGSAKYIPYALNLDGSNAAQNLDSISKVAKVDADMINMKISGRNRRALVNPYTKADLMAIEAFHRADARGDEGTALREASMGRVMGLDWYAAQNIQSAAASASDGTTMTVDGAHAKGATAVDIDGDAATTLAVGEILKIGSHTYLVRESATLDAAVDTSVSVKIYPALKEDIDDDATVGIAGAHAMNIAGDLRGISLVTVPLEQPMDNSTSAIMSNRGLSVRVVFGYDIYSKSNVLSFDLLAGCRVVHPEIVTRVATPVQ